jgi:catechol 2,3-dioxygenase-like lactoylglutathione lyase family enzyme
MKVMRIDHTGINVVDLPAAIAFFRDLGLEVMGEMDVKGEWAKQVERIIGLKNVSDKITMMGVPGGAMLELIQFHSPVDEKGIQQSFANTLGIRHICFEVDDVEGMVALLKKKHGAELVGEIQNYENIYKLCYLRGPEGIILELAEKLQ